MLTVNDCYGNPLHPRIRISLNGAGLAKHFYLRIQKNGSCKKGTPNFLFVTCIPSKQLTTPSARLKFRGKVVFSVGTPWTIHSHNGENQTLKILNTNRKFALLVPNCCLFQKLLFFNRAALVTITAHALLPIIQLTGLPTVK